MKELKMKPYRFEIVRRAFGGFGWVIVRIDDRGRRVLARSERSYRSRKRVRRAIAAFEGAPIVDATNDYQTFPLPASSFRFVPGVVPLIVDESPVEDDDAEAALVVDHAAEALGAAVTKPAAAKTRVARRKRARKGAA
jgi:hypothetical protein